jgi:hypothetical protein
MMRLPRPKAALVALSILATLAAPHVARAASTTTTTMLLPKTLNGVATLTFSHDVWHVSSSSLPFQLQDTSTDLSASRTCADANGVARSCDMGPVRTVTLKPSATLVPGQRYVILVNPQGAPSPISDYLTLNAIPAATKTFIGSLVEQENSLAASYSWRTFKTSSAYGGSFQADYLTNATITYGFTGTSVTWYTVVGSGQGKAATSIDGNTKGTINNYAATTRYKVARIFGGLSAGYHTLTIRVLGQKGSTAGKGTWVALDTFAVNGTFQAAPKVKFGWQPVSAGPASGGRYVRAGTSGASVQFTFRGRSIDWITVIGPSEGAATMYVDGVKKASLTNYAATAKYGVIRRISNLSDATHTLSIVSGTGGFTPVDRFVVRLPDLTIFHGLGTWVDLYDYGTSSGLNPSVAVPAMKSRGVRTIYIETARYTSSTAFDFYTAVGQWIEAAHANGMKIVGWYLPGYGTYLDNDVSRTVSIAKYRSPGGQGFDGLGIDIESKGQSSQPHDAWLADITTHLARSRYGATAAFPIGAIVVPPLAMQLNTFWNGFPWASVGQYANVVLPMSYWSYRKDCATNPNHCPYQYSLQNINQSRSLTGGLLVHLIGGVADSVTAQGVTDYMKACHDARAYGAGLYDYRTTTNASFWTILAGANSL